MVIPSCKSPSKSQVSPPPTLEWIRGRMRVSIFSGKGDIIGRSLGKISREFQEKGVSVVIANGNQYPR